MNERTAQLVATALQTAASQLTLTKLHGDASNRIYYRAVTTGGQSVIVMELPPGKASVSEEITNLKSTPAELPFLNIQRMLAENRFPVPKLLHNLSQDGLLILEDLGDLTLEKQLPQCSPEERTRWYEQAIDLMLQFHSIDTHSGSGCIAFQRSFDQTLFDWEFDHFLEYGIEVRLGKSLDDEDKKIFKQQSRFISFALTRLPPVLTHRDFQSRNLMIRNRSLHLIDFQDALMGPAQYDLVALLRDSYVALDWSLVEAMIHRYLSQKKMGAEAIPFFKKMFDWQTIQRKLKDAGRFVYIDRIKKNPNFLPFVPTSLRYVREALERQPELAPLFNLLKKHLPEFQA